MGLTGQEVAAFEEYFYHIMAARGSGEHALRHLLAPFARAKHPLEGRLHQVKVRCTTHCPTHSQSFMMKYQVGADLTTAVPNRLGDSVLTY